MKFAAALAALGLIASTNALVLSVRTPWCDRTCDPPMPSWKCCWKARRDGVAPPPVGRPVEQAPRPHLSSLPTLAEPLTNIVSSAQTKREAEPEAAPWCDLVGQPCWKAKRAAEALSDTISGFSGLSARNPEAIRSDAEGYHAYMAKRSIEHLANVVAVAARDAQPEAYFEGLALEKKFAVEQAPAKREAEPWCDLVGQPCWKRAVQEDKRWCDLVGQPCWKAKRAAEAVIAAVGDIKARDAEPAPEPWCDLVGQPCWKEKRDAAPEATPWCDLVGQPCWKGRRDLHAMNNAARDVLEALA